MQRLWSADELGEHWTLLPEDLALLTDLPDTGKLGLATQLAYWRQHGRFPDDEADLAPAVVGHLAAQVGVALRRIIKLLGEAGAGPEHIVRLTWYLTSRSEYEAAGPGIGAAWKETLGRNFPPSTLLYIEGLVDYRAKVEIEVTAFVPKT